MRVFVTGGTGFIGGHVVRRLAAGNHEVCCLVRTRHATGDLERFCAHIARGDIDDYASLRQGMAGADAVVHLAAAYEFWVPDRRVYRRTNVDGLRHVMECALEAGVGKVVLVSTIGVWGGTSRETVDEATPFRARRPSEYFETKYEGEKLAWELARTRGLPLVVVYPGAVLGAGDSKATGAYLGRLVRHELPATLFEDSPFPYVHVDDVAEVVVRALETPGNIGQRYIAVSENRTFGEINRMVSELAGVRLPRHHLPGAMAMAGAALLTGLARLTHRPPPLDMSLDQMRVMRAGGRADGSKAARELGVRYTPVREALREYLTTVRR